VAPDLSNQPERRSGETGPVYRPTGRCCSEQPHIIALSVRDLQGRVEGHSECVYRRRNTDRVSLSGARTTAVILFGENAMTMWETLEALGPAAGVRRHRAQGGTRVSGNLRWKDGTGSLSMAGRLPSWATRRSLYFGRKTFHCHPQRHYRLLAQE
jgi:hypothetical protein